MAQLAHQDGPSQVHVRCMRSITETLADGGVECVHNIHVYFELFFHLRARRNECFKRQQKRCHHANVGAAITLAELHELPSQQVRVARIDEILIEVL